MLLVPAALLLDLGRQVRDVQHAEPRAGRVAARPGVEPVVPRGGSWLSARSPLAAPASRPLARPAPPAQLWMMIRGMFEQDGFASDLASAPPEVSRATTSENCRLVLATRSQPLPVTDRPVCPAAIPVLLQDPPDRTALDMESGVASPGRSSVVSVRSSVVRSTFRALDDQVAPPSGSWGLTRQRERGRPGPRPWESSTSSSVAGISAS
jgi:hypothetical protein